MRPGMILLHQRQADPLRDAAMDLPLDQRRVDASADIVGRDDAQDLYRAEHEIHVDLRDLGGEAIGRIRDALAVLVERRGRRVVAPVAVEHDPLSSAS